MQFCRQVNFFIIPRTILATTLLISVFYSCTIPKHYQKNKPFVYKTSISLNTDLPAAKKQALKDGITNQLDDSLKVRKVVAVRLVPPFFYNRLSKPAVFDTSYISRSKTFMNSLLSANGYFNPTITDTFSIDTVRHQKRVTVKFFVTTGKALRIDSVGYDLQTPELQALALSTRENAFVKKDEPYSVNGISNELDRLLGTFRDRGYYKISKEDLYAEQDTVVAALIDPGLDPFEQLALLDSLQKSKKQSTINIVFRQRTPKDSSHLQKYTWGRVNVYPDRRLIADTTHLVSDSVKVGPYAFFPTTHQFKLPFLARNISIRPGSIYRQSDYFKTVNKFTNLGAWQQVDVNLKERMDSMHVLDADLLLYLAKKQSLNVDVETSRNTSEVFSAGSLFGLGVNIGVKNRNTFRESITSASNLRFGIELGKNFIQTFQTSFSHNIYIPRFVTPFKINTSNITAPRTVINFNAVYTIHKDYYILRSVNASIGYDWAKKNHSWQYIPLNVEFTTLHKDTLYLKLQEQLPSITLAFNDGLIISQIFTYTTSKSIGNNVNFFRSRIEESGAITGFIKNLERGRLRRFLKLDLEYKYSINFSKSSWVFRAFGGYGYVFGKTGNDPETNLPFFKAYFAGGPYSMRAWPVRGLGLGSSIVLDTIANSPPRFGDFKLEGNVEYRFNLGTLFGAKIKSALFADMGNIWAKTYDKNHQLIDSASFRLSRLYTDLAVGAGTSLRFDFDFFLIRLDWAYQVKNPIYARENDGWFHKLQFRDGQFQLGIGYPF